MWAYSVPYHKPKQYTLEEFMSRRTIARTTGMPQPQKAAAALKMSDNELAQYA